MAKFRKGTNDADGNGKKGGSLPDKPKAAKKPKAKPVEAEAAAPVDDVEASVGRHPGGMEPPLSVEEEKLRVAADFAAADRKADPRFDEAQAIRAVRGF